MNSYCPILYVIVIFYFFNISKLNYIYFLFYFIFIFTFILFYFIFFLKKRNSFNSDLKDIYQLKHLSLFLFFTSLFFFLNRSLRFFILYCLLDEKRDTIHKN